MPLADNKILLPQTLISPFGRGFVCDRLLQNLISDVEVSVVVFKLPYMLT